MGKSLRPRKQHNSRHRGPIDQVLRRIATGEAAEEQLKRFKRWERKRWKERAVDAARHIVNLVYPNKTHTQIATDHGWSINTLRVIMEGRNESGAWKLAYQIIEEAEFGLKLAAE